MKENIVKRSTLLQNAVHTGTDVEEAVLGFVFVDFRDSALLHVRLGQLLVKKVIETITNTAVDSGNGSYYCTI